MAKETQSMSFSKYVWVIVISEIMNECVCVCNATDINLFFYTAFGWHSLSIESIKVFPSATKTILLLHG